jgi:hypothetical protein
MKLTFRQLGMGEMERPPTQRDQFNNDDVELVDALVRETLQNSLDAKAGMETVKVRFALHQTTESEAAELDKFIDKNNLATHLVASGISPAALEMPRPPCR